MERIDRIPRNFFRKLIRSADIVESNLKVISSAAVGLLEPVIVPGETWSLSLSMCPRFDTRSDPLDSPSPTLRHFDKLNAGRLRERQRAGLSAIAQVHTDRFESSNVGEKKPLPVSAPGLIGECRIPTQRENYRFFGFYIKGNRLILTHGYLKKTQRTDPREIRRAENCMRDHLNRHRERES